MATLIIPQKKPVPEGATKEDRQKLFNDYCSEMQRLNPGHFNADGSQRIIWQWLIRLFTHA